MLHRFKKYQIKLPKPQQSSEEDELTQTINDSINADLYSNAQQIMLEAGEELSDENRQLIELICQRF